MTRTITTRRDLERACALLRILDGIVACRKSLTALSPADREHNIALIKVTGTTDKTQYSGERELKGFQIDIRSVDIVQAYLTKLKIVEDNTRDDLKESGVNVDG